MVIKNSKITCTEYFAVRVDDDVAGGTALTIEDTEIDCQGSEATGLVDADITARRLNIHGCANGLSVSHNVLLEDSYIHDLTCCTDNHPDGVQFSGQDASDLTFRHNTIYGQNNDGSPGNASIISSPSSSNILIENNLFAGGGFTLYCSDPGQGANYRVFNNHFSTRFYPKVGTFGPSIECSDKIQSGNVYHETGRPLDLD